MKSNGSVFLAVFLIFAGSLAIVIVGRGRAKALKSALAGK